MKILFALMLLCLNSFVVTAQGEDAYLKKEIILEELKRPWSIAFISEDEAIGVTQLNLRK